METGFDKFTRLMAARLPKALHHIGLLKNLTGAPYDHTPSQASDTMEQLTAGIKDIADAFGIVSTEDAVKGFCLNFSDMPKKPAPIAKKQPDVNESFIGDVRWALDKLIMGEPKQAEEFLRRALKTKSEGE